MKRVLTACFAVAFAAGLSAQATPPQTPPAAAAAAEQGQKPKPDPAQKPSTDKPQKPAPPADVTADTKGRAAATVTITGCLAAGDTPNSFVLTNVKTDDKGAEPTSEPSLSPVPPAAPPDRPAEPPTPPQPQTNPGNPPATPTTPPTAPNPPSNPEAGAPTGTSGVLQTASQTIALIGAPADLNLKAHVGHTVRITGAWAPQGKATGKTAAGRSFNVKSMEHVSAKCGG